MAKITFRGGDDFGRRLERLNTANSRNIIMRAVKKGTGLVADAIRKNLNSIPARRNIHLAKGEMLDGLQEREKKDLLESLGITPIQADKKGFVHAKVGFDGYGSTPTKKYPEGTPNQLVAASVESGSSIRNKHPFIRPAVNKTKAEAIRVMDESINADIQQIFEE